MIIDKCHLEWQRLHVKLILMLRQSSPMELKLQIQKMSASMADHLVQDNVEINKKVIEVNQYLQTLETKIYTNNQLEKSNYHSKNSEVKNQWTIAKKKRREKEIVTILVSRFSNITMKLDSILIQNNVNPLVITIDLLKEQSSITSITMKNLLRIIKSKQNWQSLVVEIIYQVKEIMNLENPCHKVEDLNIGLQEIRRKEKIMTYL